METVILTEDDHSLATEKANKMGVLNKSITKGQGNLVAHLGEIAACRYLDVPFGQNTYNYDLILHSSTFNTMRIDVKTKNCTSKPKEHYLVTVATCTRTQDCDAYLFARVLEPAYDLCWLLGWSPQKKFFEDAIFFKKGEADPYGDGEWTFKENCYNLPISELFYMRTLLPV